jgi:hypothetical protein
LRYGGTNTRFDVGIDLGQRTGQRSHACREFGGLFELAGPCQADRYVVAGQGRVTPASLGQDAADPLVVAEGEWPGCVRFDRGLRRQELTSGLNWKGKPGIIREWPPRSEQ